MNLKYIYPKKINIKNFKILENYNSYKIKYYDNTVDLYGILIEMNNFKIIKNLDNYEIQFKYPDKIKFYDDLLSSNIPNYKQILKNSSIIIKSNKIKDINKETIYINIGYVKKTGFFNIPIINIL
uniref:Uncharacterized protein n=1 Tax=viral metagenome TaxID=1070528 RepID=A0A6C0BT80_9ZZZZ